MLTQKQINEIKEELERSQNPLFFFDNDPDGLVSYLLLRRFLGRGKGIHIKTYPSLDVSYMRKVEELQPDAIFILDKPDVSQEFIDKVKEKGLPLIWIDHHAVDKPKDDYIKYYNTVHVSESNEPVSCICYNITKRKQDEWLAVAGCVADCFMPDFIDSFKAENKDLVDADYKEPFDILYNTKIGKIAMIFSFGLKDTTTNVLKMLKYLVNAGNAYDVLEENSRTRSFLHRYDVINSRHQELIERGKQSIEGNLLFFTYGGDLSISQDLANELTYRHPDKIIVVGYVRDNTLKLSLRWRGGDIREITLRVIEKIEGAHGGGHEHATGVLIAKEQLEEFKGLLIEEIKKLG
jgi:single-stranded DNA-specific DHH superfamily exonuclease